MAMQLEEIIAGVRVRGLAHNEDVTIETVKWLGDNALEVRFDLSDGSPQKTLLGRDAEARLTLIEASDTWTFGREGNRFKLAAEAHRIRLAYLFDPMLAVNASNVQPLPHQISAVYEEMLPKSPLRFLLADDPGSGKTIMAGLLMKELLVRGDLHRCLVVCPGSLAEQWQDELRLKFDLNFDLITSQSFNDARTGNPFVEKDFCIARIDQIKREEPLEKLKEAQWDLVVVDEAHKMSARYNGNTLDPSQRYRVGEVLADHSRSRHFLLMTATPHNGKEEDFQAFMRLLDQDQFEGKYREGTAAANTDGLMRRLVKEQMRTFENKPLFPPRQAGTLQYKLSPLEADLYEQVSDYVRSEMDLVKRLEAAGQKQRGNRVGFALTVLQRRLASSPKAIYESLRRRRERLENALSEAKIGKIAQDAYSRNRVFGDQEAFNDLDEELNAEDLEELEEEAVVYVDAAATVAELEIEIARLKQLEALALRVVQSGDDAKWSRLSEALQHDELMFDKATGARNKIVLFTEHRDTLEYLKVRIGNIVGHDAVVEIQGSTKRDQRRVVQDRFRTDDTVHVLLATDAAGEGINLQEASHLMMNYDLPWNPNRLEQRFGRIHRIGQKKTCFMWNLVALDTREGEVFKRLFEKLEKERQALGDQVFDVLGDALEGQSLRDIILRAIAHANDPEELAKLNQELEDPLDRKHLQELIDGRAVSNIFDDAHIRKVRNDMERAEARRLQPHFIRAFFTEAFRSFGGVMLAREAGRAQIKKVPQKLKSTMWRTRLGDRYERICFDRKGVDVPNKPHADLVAPGHPLLEATIDAVLEADRTLLKSGAVLVDVNDPGLEPSVICILEHAIRDGVRDSAGNARTISRRMQFVRFDADGAVTNAGPAPYLDYEQVPDDVWDALQPHLADDWYGDGLESIAIGYAADKLAPEHGRDVQQTRIEQIDRTIAAVRARLIDEINKNDFKATQARMAAESGKQIEHANYQVYRDRADDLQGRLDRRLDELERQKQFSSQPPLLVGRALVVPQGLIDEIRGESPVVGGDIAKDDVDPEERKRVEMIAMREIERIEQRLGNEVTDVSKLNLGWDIESRGADDLRARFIEVKGRSAAASFVTVTKNEALAALNKAEDFILAIVRVDGDQVVETLYVPRPYTDDIPFFVASQNWDIDELRRLAVSPDQIRTRTTPSEVA